MKNNNNKNKNNSKEGTAESVKGQRAVAPLTLINIKSNPCYNKNKNKHKSCNKNREVFLLCRQTYNLNCINCSRDRMTVKQHWMIFFLNFCHRRGLFVNDPKD